MPLLDHFHAPQHSWLWPSFATCWAVSMTGWLNTTLSRRYLASCHFKLGRHVEADVAEYDGTAWVPPVAASVMPAGFPDDAEVWITDTSAQDLVAVVELVSPGNKDRDEVRNAFTDKCAAYLQRGIGLVVVDVVTERLANLHNHLIERLRHPDEFRMTEDAGLYATAYRPARRDEKNLIDLWLYRLALGEALPTVPLAIRGAGVVPLELEETYTRARQMSRL